MGKVEEEVELVANAEELRLLDRLGAPFATVARRCWSSPWVWLQLAHCIAVHYIFSVMIYISLFLGRDHLGGD